MRYRLLIAVTAATALTAGAGLALAAGESTGSSTTGSSINVNKPSVKTCKTKGMGYSKKYKKCVTLRKKKKKKKMGAVEEAIPDRDLIDQGWALANAGLFEHAIAVFQAVADADNPKVLNGLGYSNRKLGRLDVGIGFYKRALAIDPDYVRAREYLGEGYVTAGKLDLAKEQLRKIEKRCGVTCEEYVDLAAAIAKAQAGLTTATQ